MKKQPVASLFLRIALAASFLSAVADRFGLWGAAGAPGVAWGNFASFTSYTAKLNPWAPASLIPPIAWMATVAEVLLAILLLAGIAKRWTAIASGLLLLAFAIGMMANAGSPKPPLDYSVFTAAAAAFVPAGERRS